MRQSQNREASTGGTATPHLLRRHSEPANLALAHAQRTSWIRPTRRREGHWFEKKSRNVIFCGR